MASATCLHSLPRPWTLCLAGALCCGWEEIQGKSISITRYPIWRTQMAQHYCFIPVTETRCFPVIFQSTTMIFLQHQAGLLGSLSWYNLEPSRKCPYSSDPSFIMWTQKEKEKLKSSCSSIKGTVAHTNLPSYRDHFRLTLLGSRSLQTCWSPVVQVT